MTTPESGAPPEFPGCPEGDKGESCRAICTALATRAFTPARSRDGRLYAFREPQGGIRVCPVPCVLPNTRWPGSCQVVARGDPVLLQFPGRIPTLIEAWHVNPREGLPQGDPGPFGPGRPGGGFPPTQPGGGGGGFGIAGVSVGDILRFLGGIGATADTAGIVRAIAALVFASDRVRSVIGGLPAGLEGVVGEPLAQLSTAFLGGQGRLASEVAAALEGATDKTQQSATARVATGIAAVAAMVAPVTKESIPALAAQLERVPELYKEAVEAFIRHILDLFRDDIEAQVPVTPANVDKVAAAALRAAITAGSVAQIAGMALELLHPIKSMGVQQAIGILAEFAGFGEIAKPFFGATLRHGIGKPAEYRAAKHFRTTLPDPEQVRELAAIGLVPLGKYRERLELAGYPEPYPAAFTDIVYSPPAARFLAQLLDGSESDAPWLARQFKRLGFSPENIERAVRAAELKTTAPGRSRLASEWLAEYQRGHVTAEELAQGLEAAGLSPRHRAYWQRVALLGRRGTRMEAIATAALAQYRNDRVGRAAAGQLLASLGFTDDEVSVRLLTADLQRQQKLVADEEAGLETEIRTLKAQGLANARRQLRAGFLAPDVFVTVGVGMGYAAPLLRNIVELELLKGPTTSLEGAPAIGLGALQETQARLTELLAQQVRLKQVDRLEALATVARLGLPTDLASIVLDVAEAIAGRNALAGDFGFPTGGEVGGSFATILAEVTAGLAGISSPLELARELLKRLGIKAGDRGELTALIDDLVRLFTHRR